MISSLLFLLALTGATTSGDNDEARARAAFQRGHELMSELERASTLDEFREVYGEVLVVAAKIQDFGFDALGFTLGAEAIARSKGYKIDGNNNVSKLSSPRQSEAAAAKSLEQFQAIDPFEEEATTLLLEARRATQVYRDTSETQFADEALRLYTGVQNRYAEAITKITKEALQLASDCRNQSSECAQYEVFLRAGWHSTLSHSEQVENDKAILRAKQLAGESSFSRSYRRTVAVMAQMQTAPTQERFDELIVEFVSSAAELGPDSAETLWQDVQSLASERGFTASFPPAEPLAETSQRIEKEDLASAEEITPDRAPAENHAFVVVVAVLAGFVLLGGAVWFFKRGK